MGPTAGLDDVEKRKFLTLLGLELRPLGCPACSQSLSWLLCEDISGFICSMEIYPAEGTKLENTIFQISLKGF
jgi:hypothetical protein